MTESQYTAKLCKELKAYMPDAIVWKVSDRFNAGRPDVQVILDGVTTYIECKLWPKRPTKIQQYYLDRIGKRAYWIQFAPMPVVNWREGSIQCSDIRAVAALLACWCNNE